MNLQTYQTCIKTLQNQIKSREQQRQSMQAHIIQLDQDLAIQFHKNKTLRKQLIYLAQNNQNVINDIRHLEQIIQQKEQIIQNHIIADQGRVLYIQALQRDKTALTEQLNQKELIITQKITELADLGLQLKNALQSTKGYQYAFEQKTIEFTQLTIQLQDTNQQLAQTHQKLLIAQNQHQKQLQQFLDKLLQSQSSAKSLSAQLQQNIDQLQNQLAQQKQFSKNQIATLQYNKEAEVSALQKQISSKDSLITALLQQITQLKDEQTKVKQHYEVQIDNNDKVVNTLINEINFLKQEKIQLKKQSSTELDQSTQKGLLMAKQLAEKQTQIKATQNLLQSLKQDLIQKQKEASGFKKQIEKLNLQVQISRKETSAQKDTVIRKNQQILELKRFIDNLKKFAQVSDKQKQSLIKKTTKQIESLKKEKQLISKKLEVSSNELSELQQLRFRKTELQQTVKFLTFQQSNNSTAITELQILVKTHEYTIEKLQHMLEQTKKVVIDLNKLMKTKLAEIDSLEISNNMFRKQKVQWLKKQEDYRKKIAEYKAVSSAAKRITLGQSSFMSKGRKSYHQKEKIEKSKVHSMVVPNSNDKQFTQLPSDSFNDIKKKTTASGNWNQRGNSLEDINMTGSEYESCNQSMEEVLRIPIAENAFKKAQVLRINKKYVDFADGNSQTPIIPVLITMKKDQNIKSQSEQAQNSLEKSHQNHQEKKCEQDHKIVQNYIETPQQSIKQNILQKIVEAPLQKIDQRQRQKQESQMQQSPQQNIEDKIKSVDTQTPNTKENIQTGIQVKSQNLTPQFHVQSLSPCSNNDEQNVDNQSEYPQGDQQADPTYGYQTLEEFEQEQRRLNIPKKISPINSRVLVKHDQLIEILEDDEMTQLTEKNQISELKDLKQAQEPQENFQQLEQGEDDSVQAQNTVQGINILLDRINTQ